MSSKSEFKIWKKGWKVKWFLKDKALRASVEIRSKYKKALPFLLEMVQWKQPTFLTI